jgi:putative oxygen-independent coproporphyrinogen III oxidase
MDSLAIYIHWPFCRSICPYCDFNRYIAPELDWAVWETSFLKEIAYWGKRTGPRTVASIFFGGGTPSLMKPELTKKLIEAISHTWVLPQWSEVTLEMNPTDVEHVLAFQQAGINRISMGVQSFNQDTLSFLGRTHTVEHIHSALAHLKSAQMRYSFDLIYGHKHHEHGDQWTQELTQALPWVSDHLSLYELSYEQGTPFYHKRYQTLADERILELEDITERFLSPLGLERYEISNYATPGGQSQHNLMYWTYQDFLGLGPGAHGRLTERGCKIATQAHSLPRHWLAALEEEEPSLAINTSLSREEWLQEQLLMGLRLLKGLDITDLFLPHEEVYPSFYERIDLCRMQGLITPVGLALTLKGRCVLNSVVTYVCSTPIIKNAV